MAKPRATLEPQYEDLDLYTEWVHEAGHDTLIAYLPGFQKEQLKVQLTSTAKLRLTGERQVSENRWTRFRKEFLIPPNCDVNQVTANFKGGMLHVKLPKHITPAPAPAQQQADSSNIKQKPPPPPTTEKGKPTPVTGAVPTPPPGPTTTATNQTQKNNRHTQEPKPVAPKPVPEKTEQPMKPPATEPHKQPMTGQEKPPEKEKMAKEEKTMDPEKAPKKEETPNFVEGESSKNRSEKMEACTITAARTKVIGKKISDQTKEIGIKVSDVLGVYKGVVGDIVTELTSDRKKMMVAMAVVLVAAAVGYVTKRAFESSDSSQ